MKNNPLMETSFSFNKGMNHNIQIKYVPVCFVCGNLNKQLLIWGKQLQSRTIVRNRQENSGCKVFLQAILALEHQERSVVQSE